ncbi:MAG: T9SS type A sorting domain-containing protein [Bacteroidota bacterium]
MLLRLLLCTGLLAALCAPAAAQYVPRGERGERDAERKTLIDANRVAITHFNYGLGGGVGEVRGNWPKGSDDFYLGDFQLIVGAEVTDENGMTVQNVVTSRSPRAGQDGPPGQSSVFWGFEAVPSYQNPESETWARSDDPASWPDVWPDRLGDADDPGWPGAWNGLLGKDAFIDGVELYSHYADNPDEEFDYVPDPANPERGGLGLVVAQRVLAWRDPLLEDAVVYVYDVYNASPKPLDTAALGFVLGTLAGGDGDSVDDLIEYDFDRDVGYWLDFDNSGNQGQPVGVAGLALLQTPTVGGVEIGMTGVFGFDPPGAVRMDDDDRLFEILTRDGANDEDIERCALSGGCDGDLIVSAGPFALPALSSQRVVAALVFGEDRAEAEGRIDVLRGFVRNGYVLSGGTAVAITSPGDGDVVKDGTVEVAWTAEGEDLRVALDYSDDFGQTWTPLARDEPNDGGYIWNASSFPAGVYQVRVTAYGPGGLGSAASGRFRLDSAGNAAPQVVLGEPQPGTVSGVYPVTWTAADADGDDPVVALSYRTAGGPWLPLAGDLPAEGTFAWDTAPLPNAPDYQLRAEADDGAAVGTDITAPFAVENERDGIALPPTFEGLGTGTLAVRVVDAAALTEHTYRVAFKAEPTGTAYDVTNLTTGALVLSDVPVASDGSEGPLFDGLRLVVLEDEAAVDPARTAWADPEGLIEVFADRINIDIPFPREWVFQGTAAPYDYEVRFDDDLVGQSFGGFTLGSGSSAPMAVATETNFTVQNTTLDRPAPFVFLESREESANGRLDDYEFVFVYEDLDGDPGTDSEPTYIVRPARTDPEGSFPAEGDVLALRTFKPFATGDAFQFVASQTVDAEEAATPAGVRFGGVFPNPVRRSATLVFETGRAGAVRLAVYDVLGRKVAVLASGERPSGVHEVRLDARGLASGIYIIRLDAAGQTHTRRLTVLD